MDERIVRSLNGWFSATSFRADLARFLALAPLVAVVGLVVLAWLADWGRAPDRRAILIVGALGAILALALNVALGHLYFRPRPFLVLSVHALLPHPSDSSLYSDQLAIAGALTGALFAARRWLGAVSFLLAVLLAIGRVGAAVHFPSDVVVGFGIGAVSFAILLPARRPIGRLVAVMSSAEATVIRRERQEGNFLFRHGPVVAVSVLVAVAGLGYGMRALQDHGRIEAGSRAEAELLGPREAVPPVEFAGTSIATIAGGRYSATHASVVGDVTEVTRELDGDIHIRVEGSGAFIVAEIIPELPIDPPHVGQQITAWGIVRHDGLHNWWELHPLIGWEPGDVVQPSSPGPGTGD
ncbi:MAG: phosphatase PAP2 family protein [Actinobacteria bacterium]|nr:MAG: phosphatase PAP2 family protein [Actinomycetota bacterium]